MTPTLYRALLLASIAIGVIGGTLDLIFPALLPDAFRAAQTEYDEALADSHAIMLGLGAVLLLIVLLCTTYGLYRFRSWARSAALISTAFALATYPLIGPTSQSGLAASVDALASYLWGAILALSFVPPIAGRFTKPGTEESPKQSNSLWSN
jgi:uncharacterized membrane protein (DUF2068 family)